jgi:pimeloyl-ACP methyl ester carboxylesterase
MFIHLNSMLLELLVSSDSGPSWTSARKSCHRRPEKTRLQRGRPSVATLACVHPATLFAPTHYRASAMVFAGLMQSLLISTIDFARFCRGFRGKTAQVDEFEWSFMERDAKAPDTTEPVVFVHGFSSAKESWTRLAARIDKKYQIVVPDLPGQGRTLPADPSCSYTMDDQAERLHKFLEATIPADRKVHLVGCSMGAMLAGVYSATYPNRVRSLTMICPAGITMPNKSDAYKLLDDEGKNLLLAETPDEMAEMFSYISHRPVPIPRFVISFAAKYRARHSYGQLDFVRFHSRGFVASCRPTKSPCSQRS